MSQVAFLAWCHQTFTPASLPSRFFVLSLQQETHQNMKQQRFTGICWLWTLALWACSSAMAHAQTFTNIRATQTMIIRSMVEDEQHRIWFASGKSVYCITTSIRSNGIESTLQRIRTTGSTMWSVTRMHSWSLPSMVSTMPL